MHKTFIGRSQHYASKCCQYLFIKYDSLKRSFQITQNPSTVKVINLKATTNKKFHSRDNTSENDQSVHTEIAQRNALYEKYTQPTGKLGKKRHRPK